MDGSANDAGCASFHRQQQLNALESRCSFMELPPVLILEVFKHLDARELSIVACVCPLFRLLVSDSHGWKDFYCERWGMPGASSLQVPEKSWKELYAAREARCKALLGKFRMDMLFGHTDTVKAVRMLPSANLVVSAGYDTAVRLWDLEEGMPITWSGPLYETIRAIAVDQYMLAVAGSNGIVRVWHAALGCSHLFQLLGKRARLHGHSGPISCLGLDSSNLYSGSWDMSIRLWDRSRLRTTKTLAHWDWVWALAARGHRILSTAGSDAYTWDIETGTLLRFRRRVHEGQVYAVEGNRTGNYIITGGEDGAVRVFDNRIPPQGIVDDDGEESSSASEAVAAWKPHSNAVNSLAFDDPWLVSASADGTIAMMDLRHVMRRGKWNGAALDSKWKHSHSYVVKPGDTVQRMLSSGGQSAHSVDISGDRIISAGEETVIRIWDFSQALEIERRVQASRNIRQEQRMLRKEGKSTRRTDKAERAEDASICS